MGGDEEEAEEEEAEGWAEGGVERRMQVRKQREAVCLSDPAKCATPCEKRKKNKIEKQNGEGATHVSLSFFLSVFFLVFFVLFVVLPLPSTLLPVDKNKR